MQWYKTLVKWLSIVGIVALSSCQSTTNKRVERPILSVSLLPEKYFVEQIIGELAEVHVLVPYGSNPETYDPSPKDIAKLQASKAYFTIGTLPFEEQWVRSLPDSVKVTNILQLLPDDLLDKQHSHDPHYWTSLKGGRAMAEVILEALLTLFPNNHEEILQNYQANIAPRLEELEALGRSIFTRHHSLAFVIYHPSLTLFAEEWGLTQLAIEKDGKEPTPKQLMALIDKARTLDTRAILVQEEFDTKNSEAIAKELGLNPITIQPLAEDWAGEMKRLMLLFE